MLINLATKGTLNCVTQDNNKFLPLSAYLIQTQIDQKLKRDQVVELTLGFKNKPILSYRSHKWTPYLSKHA